jgi:hypothetical protein
MDLSEMYRAIVRRHAANAMIVAAISTAGLHPIELCFAECFGS